MILIIIYAVNDCQFDFSEKDYMAYFTKYC